MLENYKTCCICGKVFEGYGKNPKPIREDGECCYECYVKHVVPEMIGEIKIKADEITEDSLGKLVKKMRKSRGLTQLELAEGVASDVSSICKWEKSGSPSWWKFIDVSNFLDYEIEINLKRKEEDDCVSCIEMNCLWNTGEGKCICPTEDTKELVADKDLCKFYSQD